MRSGHFLTIKWRRLINRTTVFLVATIFSVSLSALADKPEGSVYIDGGVNRNAIILVHGKGKHPTWLVVEPLRTGVNDSLGFHTLSLQMPTGHPDWKDYADDFPQAYDIIKDAIRFLKDEKGVSRIFLVGHSMGSRMASSFVSENPDHLLSGLIVAGCRNNGSHPLSCEENLRSVEIPVLDIWGGENGKDSDAASDRKYFLSSTYKQVEITGANHKFEGYDSELVTAVVGWLKTLQRAE